jgi:hypothetical protein
LIVVRFVASGERVAMSYWQPRRLKAEEIGTTLIRASRQAREFTKAPGSSGFREFIAGPRVVTIGGPGKRLEIAEGEIVEVEGLLWKCASNSPDETTFEELEHYGS